MPQAEKILSHGDVVEIVTRTRVPKGQVSADDLVVSKIEAYMQKGYKLDAGAQRELEIRKKNGLPA